MARTVSIIADASTGRFFVAEANGTRIPLNRDGYSTDKNALRALARHYDFKAVPGCPYAYSIEATDREIAPPATSGRASSQTTKPPRCSARARRSRS